MQRTASLTRAIGVVGALAVVTLVAAAPAYAETISHAEATAVRGSVAMTPTPPPLVRMASLSPTSLRCRASISAALKRSFSSRTRNKPARRNAASKAASAPAKAPVCESAALAPVALRPALTTMTGLDLAARRAADMNFGACVSDSI